MERLYSIEQLRVIANKLLEGNSRVVNLQQIKEVFYRQGLKVVEFEGLYKLDIVND